MLQPPHWLSNLTQKLFVNKTSNQNHQQAVQSQQKATTRFFQRNPGLSRIRHGNFLFLPGPVRNTRFFWIGLCVLSRFCSPLLRGEESSSRVGWSRLWTARAPPWIGWVERKAPFVFHPTYLTTMPIFAGGNPMEPHKSFPGRNIIPPSDHLGVQVCSIPDSSGRVG